MVVESRNPPHFHLTKSAITLGAGHAQTAGSTNQSSGGAVTPGGRVVDFDAMSVEDIGSSAHSTSSNYGDEEEVSTCNVVSNFRILFPLIHLSAFVENESLMPM